MALQDDEDARAEIYNHVTGDFLTEPKDLAESALGPGRLLVTRYKGMTSEAQDHSRRAGQTDGGDSGMA